MTRVAAVLRVILRISCGILIEISEEFGCVLGHDHEIIQIETVGSRRVLQVAHVSLAARSRISTRLR